MIYSSFGSYKDKLSERIDVAESVRDDANNERNELMAAIDAELGFIGGGIGEGDINKLLKALKNGGLANLGGDDDDDEEAEDEDEDYVAPLKVSSKKEDNYDVDDDVFDDIDQSSKLDADKKEALLVQAQNDQALAQANIDREEQRKAEMLAALEEDALKKQEEAAAEDASNENNEEELQDLQRSQEETRQDKLKHWNAKSIVHPEAGDTPHDVECRHCYKSLYYHYALYCC